MASLGGLILPTSILLEVLALTNPSDKRLKVAATAASVYLLVFFLVNPPPGSFMTVWPLGMNIYGLAQRCINYLWLKSPIELQRKNDVVAARRDGKGSAVSHSIMDALEIAVTFRGVGWSFEAKGLPSPPSESTSRFQFASSQVFGALWRFLALDLAITYANTSIPTVSDVSIPLRLALGALMMFYVRWTMDIPYRLLSAFSVLMGFNKPDEWPPLFGEWKDAYSLRRFWSHTWHQGMRLIAEPPVNLVVNQLLRLPKGTYFSHWTKVFGNFLMAFVDHAYGRVLAGGDPVNDWVMFIAQPVAIWVEETLRDVAVACGLVDKHRKSALELWLGYLWTVAFECWTFLAFMEGAIRVHGNVPAVGLIEPAFGSSAVFPIVKWYTGSSA